jgi:enoyl-CoA hydratase/carnithine racemase
MTDELVRVDEDRGICRIVMTAGANPLNLGLMEALRSAVAVLRSGGGPPFLLASSHPKIFCPGWDLKRLVTAQRPLVREFLARFNELILDLFSYPGATVAAIAGHAIAGGCLLALACDVRVMAAGRSRIGQSEVNLGVPVPAESLLMLSSRLAPHVVEEVVFGCDGYTAERARQLGMVNHVAAATEAAAAAELKLRTLAAKPRRAYREAKRFLHEGVWLEMGRQRESAAEGFLDSWFERDTQQRILALAGSLSG